MSRIVLIRHAETALAGRFCGHSDPDLNHAGKMQLARIAQQVAPLGIERIVSSDLSRASRTAQAIGRGIGVQPELRPRLREIHLGLWEELSWDEIEERFPREAHAWVRDFPTRSAPHGESYRAFCQRVKAEFTPLLQGRADQVTAVVSHSGVMRYVLTRFFGRSEQEAFEQTAAYGAVVTVFNPSTVQDVMP